MELKNNPVVWFEIPVASMDRAIQFYEKVFSFTLSRNVMGPLEMAWFPSERDGLGATGSLVYNREFYRPSNQGVLVYFTSPTGDLDRDLKNVENAGGKIIIPKKLISEEIGFMCVFEDSEGNRIALHTAGK